MINMNMMERMENGITNGWYPPVEEVKPRVYHEYLRDMEKENIYGCKCIGTEECTHDDESVAEDTTTEEPVMPDVEPDVTNNTGNVDATETEDDEDPQQPTE